MDPAEERLIDYIGRDDEVLRVIDLLLDNGRNHTVFHKDLAVLVIPRSKTALLTYDIVVNLDVHDIVFDSVIGAAKATCKIIDIAHFNFPFLVCILAFKEFVQKREIMRISGSFNKDDSIQQATVLHKVALRRLLHCYMVGRYSTYLEIAIQD
ncbi:hypothetical protein HG530_010341 [Fusarium avenaceum]|nr:hypothetical protein HG530_010341 [Fusarium avenaceum]